MKKIISLLLCVVMVGLCIIPVLAGDTDDFVFDSWDSVLSENDESIVRALATNRKGDLNGDYLVSGVDARKLLRAVAGFKESFDFIQESEADINGDGKMSAVDARMILQMVAGTKTVDTVAETTMDEGLVIGPLRISGGTAYYWQCEVDKDGLTVLERDFDKSEPNVFGGPVNQYFAFTPEAKGTYTINFKLANAKQTEIIDEFKCVLTAN
ncbi:MAG: protease inhibitor I42 family protein [Clostridia bacterium]|nr:protease inhibitor I42 family protein [Clostridia bacterium]